MAWLFLIFWGQAFAAQSMALEGYRQAAFQLPAGTEELLAADADGDGLKDLIARQGRTLTIYFQDREGFDFATGFAQVDLPGTSIGWDIANLDGAPALSVLALVDGAEVMAWTVSGRAFSQPAVLLANPRGTLSRGVHRLRFARDINRDGLTDLIVPVSGLLALHLRQAGGGFQPPVAVQADIRLRTRLGGNSLERQTGQFISIPLMELKDVNGDGRPDLVSRTDEKLDVYIAGNGARTFAPEPSYSLDIAAIEGELGEFDVDKLDFSNLTGVLALTHEEILDDVDSDGIQDVLVRQGGKVSLFKGDARGLVDFGRPAQVLRSSGNVLGTFLHDEDGDGLKDLWLWRVEAVSLGDVFLWLALSGNIALDAFVYPNDGAIFARRPSRRLTVNLKFPSVLRVVSTVNQITRDLREAAGEPPVPARAADLGGGAGGLDLLALAGDRLDIFLHAVAPEANGEPFLAVLDYSRERDHYEIDVRGLIEKAVAGNSPLEGLNGRAADLEVALSGDAPHGDILTAELNGDGRDDIFVFFARNRDHIRGMLLLSDSS